MYKLILLIVLFFGILFVSVEVARINAGLTKKDPTVIYRYIPRSFEEEQNDPILVSDIFETMFSQPSPWVGSIRTYDQRKHDAINKYFSL